MVSNANQLGEPLWNLILVSCQTEALMFCVLIAEQ
jgi:hypothetical protein